MRNSSKIYLSFAATVLLIVSGISVFYKSRSQADTIDNAALQIHSFDVEWVVKKSSLPSVTDFVSKKTEYKKTISFETPNLKEITFRLTWTDDTTAFFGLFGRDTLTLTITTPEGTRLTESARCERFTKQGLIEITIPVKNTLPSPVRFQSTSIIGAGQQLLDTSFDYTWVNEKFTLEISDRVGEIRLLKRLLDTGNVFNLEITSQYYQASIRDDESLGEISDTPGDTIKESGMVPPSACPFCDGVSMHDPWCPYYEDPFDDDDPFEDDPWDDHSYNDPWDDDHDYEPIPVDEPWQILFTFAVFLLWMFFGNILIFGGLF